MFTSKLEKIRENILSLLVSQIVRFDSMKDGGTEGRRDGRPEKQTELGENALKSI